MTNVKETKNEVIGQKRNGGNLPGERRRTKPYSFNC